MVPLPALLASQFLTHRWCIVGASSVNAYEAAEQESRVVVAV